MTTNQTIDGSRELLERIAESGGYVPRRAELRALLDGPTDPKPTGLSQGWNLTRKHDGFVVGHQSVAYPPDEKAIERAERDGYVWVPFLVPAAQPLGVTVIGAICGGDAEYNTVNIKVGGSVPSELWTLGNEVTVIHGHPTMKNHRHELGLAQQRVDQLEGLLRDIYALDLPLWMKQRMRKALKLTEGGSDDGL